MTRSRMGAGLAVVGDVVVGGRVTGGGMGVTRMRLLGTMAIFAFMLGGCSSGAEPAGRGSTTSWVQAAQISRTAVAPGATVTEEIVVFRPFQRFHPYGNDIGYGEIKLPDPAKEVLFRRGVLLSASQLTVIHMSGTTASQYVFCSEPAAL